MTNQLQKVCEKIIVPHYPEMVYFKLARDLENWS